RCSRPRAALISSAVREAAFIFWLSIQIRTWRFRPPLIVTEPTPGIFSISRFRTLKRSPAWVRSRSAADGIARCGSDRTHAGDLFNIALQDFVSIIGQVPYRPV